MSCQHHHFSLGVMHKYFLNETFSFETDICDECQHYLWTKNIEMKYKQWLAQLYKTNRHRFQIQCQLSSNVLKVALEFQKDYPSIKLTAIFRALVITYIHFVDPNKELLKTIETILDSSIEASYKLSPKESVKIQFNPYILLDINAVALILGWKTSYVVEFSIIKMMTILTSTNEPLEVFWRREVLVFFETILKAA